MTGHPLHGDRFCDARGERPGEIRRTDRRALCRRGVTRVTEPAPYPRSHRTHAGGQFRRPAACASGSDAFRFAGGQSSAGRGRIAGPGATSPPQRSLWLRRVSVGGEGLTAAVNVGMNPTRTGLLEILTLDGRRHPKSRTRGSEGRSNPLRICRPRDPAVGASWHPKCPLRSGAAGHRRIPGVLHRRGLRRRARSLLRGAEELRVKESDRLADDGRRALSGLASQHELLPDGMRIRGRPVIWSTAFSGGQRRQSWRPSHRHVICSCGSLRAGGAIEILTTRRMSRRPFPGFVEPRPADRSDIGRKLSQRRALSRARAMHQPIECPARRHIAHHRWPFRLRQRHGQSPIVAAAPRLASARFSGALYRLVALSGMQQAAWMPRMWLATHALADGHGRCVFGSQTAMAPSEILNLGRRGRHPGHPGQEDVSQGASRVAAWPPVREPRCSSASGDFAAAAWAGGGRSGYGHGGVPAGAALKVFLTASPEERAA